MNYRRCRNKIHIKFGLSEKHTKFEKIWTFTKVNVQSMRKISQIFVCFSESPNFIMKFPLSTYAWIFQREDLFRHSFESMIILRTKDVFWAKINLIWLCNLSYSKKFGNYLKSIWMPYFFLPGRWIPISKVSKKRKKI